MTTEAKTQASDILAMSDDEILNMPIPSMEGSQQNNPKDDVSEPAPIEEPTEVVEPTEEAEDVEPVEEEETPTKPVEPVEEVNTPTEVKKEVVEELTKSEPTTVDYEANYNRIMAPFKANGRTIVPQSPEEVISLMQMGANYTRKLQEIQPHRKVLLMLENNGLLDEGKLSYLIDIDKKNPDAIKKLLKDSGIDPLDINVDEQVNYQVGNHRVSDTEAAFATELDELKSTQEGQATLQVISKTWDDTSKNALFDNRGLLQTIHSQIENGIYDRISNEVSRLTMLGQIPAGTPFLTAYNQVGNHLASTGGFADLVKKPEPTQVVTPAPAVATRVATPKPTVANSQQASAASPSRAAPRKAERFVNPLAMSDEDFAKLPIPGRL